MGTPIPINRARFDLATVLRVTGGAVIARGAIGDAEAVGVSTDTRALPRGAAFVALRGESFDGHAHLDAAAAAGAPLAIVERDVPAPPSMAVVRVPSTLHALGALAREHARRWRALGGARTTVAITGSAGKTTTRVALAALASATRPAREVHSTSGNLNNRVGAPLVLFGLEPEHRFCIVEIGTNQPGEVAELASVVEPDAAVLTLIAAAHLEGLGSLDGVAAEKGALLRALPSRGLAVANGDDARARRALADAPAAQKVTYGHASGCDYRIARREALDLAHARVWLERTLPTGGVAALSLTTPLLGEAGALACAAAVAVIEALEGKLLDEETVSGALASADVGGGAGRLLARTLPDGLALIDDSYNANPASSAASIRAAAELARASGRRLVLVLGEMRELGAEAEASHDELGRVAGESGAAEVIAVAGAARRIVAAAERGGARARFAETVAEAIPLVLEVARAGDLVLVKGSRGVATERVVRALVDAHDPTPGPAATRLDSSGRSEP